MECGQIDLLIHGYLDEELDAKTNMEVGEHIGQCERCGNNMKVFKNQSAALQSDELYYHASDYLRKRIHSSIKKEAQPWYASLKSPPRAFAVALSLAVLAFVIWRIVPSSGKSEYVEMVRAEILDSHVRALLSDHIVDVPSTDQHTVKPWFNNKIDYSPDVKNLDAEGFMLAGGRLEYIDGKPVAVIVYRRAKHIIDLYSWPASEGRMTLSSLTTVHGYHMLAWTSANSTNCAVSDVEESQLEQFRELLIK